MYTIQKNKYDQCVKKQERMRNAQIENPNIKLPVERVFNLEEAI